MFSKKIPEKDLDWFKDLCNGKNLYLFDRNLIITNKERLNSAFSKIRVPHNALGGVSFFVANSKKSLFELVQVEKGDCSGYSKIRNFKLYRDQIFKIGDPIIFKAKFVCILNTGAKGQYICLKLNKETFYFQYINNSECETVSDESVLGRIEIIK